MSQFQILGRGPPPFKAISDLSAYTNIFDAITHSTTKRCTITGAALRPFPWLTRQGQLLLELVEVLRRFLERGVHFHRHAFILHKLEGRRLVVFVELHRL